MKNRLLFISAIMGLGLVLVLAMLWTVGGGVPVSAAAPAQSALEERAQVVPIRSPDTPDAEIKVCPTALPGCNYTTIQEAVDAANPGDIIKVAAGTYAGVNGYGSLSQVVYISKTVTIRGGYAYPNWTTPGVAPSVVDAQTEGRGLYITGSISPTIEYLSITRGEATGLGGGMWLGYDGTGGGIYVYTATATINNCLIYNNVAGRYDWSAGGGVYLHYSSATLTNNAIFDNSAGISTTVGLGGEGGGVSIAGGSPILVGNLLEYNTAATGGSGLGGGVYMEVATPTLKDNIIQRNTASSATYGCGGGIYNGPFSDARLVNTVLVDNVSGPDASSRGAGFYAEISSAELVHTTLHDNTGGDGSGIYAWGYGFGDCTLALSNTIVTSQTVGIKTESDASYDAIVTLDGVLWYNNGANTGGTDPVTATSEITGTPDFAPDGFHLLCNSAAIDAGLDAGVSWDIDGETRPYGSGYDLGADEAISAVSGIFDPGVGGTLMFTDTQGLTTSIQIPPGALSETVLFVFTPLLSPTHPLSPGVQFANHAFNLDTYCFPTTPEYTVYLPIVLRDSSSGTMAWGERPSAVAPGVVSNWQSPESGLPSQTPFPCTPVLQEPITITIHYSDADVAGIDENTLRMVYWEGSQWEDVTLTCSPPSSYIRDPVGNVLGVAICHLTEYSIIGD